MYSEEKQPLGSSQQEEPRRADESRCSNDRVFLLSVEDVENLVQGIAVSIYSFFSSLSLTFSVIRKDYNKIFSLKKMQIR